MIPSLRSLALFSFIFLLSGCSTVEELRQWAFTPKATHDAFIRPQVIPEHESWCYRTLAQVDCYSTPQDVPSESLVGVDPPMLHPLTRQAHEKALNESREKIAALHLAEKRQVTEPLLEAPVAPEKGTPPQEKQVSVKPPKLPIQKGASQKGVKEPLSLTPAPAAKE